MTGVEEILTQRKTFGERFSVAPVAYSPDGRDIGFAGRIELGVELGGLAMIDTPEGGGDVPTTWTTPT